MGTEKRNSYSKEFKKNAIKLVMEEGRKPTEVARDLGIHENLIYNWQRKHKDRQEEAFTGHGKMTGKDEYIHKLEQENKRLKDERDILKKAAIFFAKDP
jgi:transposase